MTIDAETAKVNKDLAEARQFDANAIKASAEADLFVLQKADLEVHFRSTERDERLSRITTTTNRTLVVWGQINEELIYTNIFRLRTFVHEAEYLGEKPSAIDVIICGPGGEAFTGMALFDEIAAQRRAGWVFNGYVRGWASSMSGILLQACTNRYVGPESWLLIHEPSMQTSGKASDLDDNAAWLRRMSDRMVNVFLDRCDNKITRTAFMKKYNRQDWALNATEALGFGFADDIR